MERAAPTSTLRIRPYEDGDQEEVIALLRMALGEGPSGHRSPSLFRWKHLANPFGRSLMLVAQGEGRILGLRAFLRWRFESGDQVFRAVRAVDTATHPAFQGRGIFSRLTREAMDLLQGDVDLIYNTPNEKSLPGYLKLGWRTVGRVSVHVRVTRPFHLALGLTRRRASPAPKVDAETAAEALSGEDRVAGLVEAARRREARLSTPLSVRYLRWRYGQPPDLDYRAIWAEHGDGLAIFRVRPRFGGYGISIADVLVPAGDVATARSLIRSVVQSTRVDHVVCSFPRGWVQAKAASRSGFVRAPRGVTLVAKPLTATATQPAAALDDWALSLGDLEVF